MSREARGATAARPFMRSGAGKGTGGARLAGIIALAALGTAILLFGISQALASPPTATVESPTGISDTEATLHGHLDPAENEITECRFEWGEQSFSLTETAACEEGATFTEPAAVTAVLTGLTPGKSYFYRLTVTNGEGTSESSTETFRTLAPPTSERTFVTEVNETTATMNALLNPEGAATSYHFEYVPESSFEASGFSDATAAPVPDAQLSASRVTVTASTLVEGLQPDTRYEYRIVASNAFGTYTGPTKAFRTATEARVISPGAFPGQGFLPDNRAWEMVTPPDKNGGGVRAGDPRTIVSEDGSKVLYTAAAAFGNIRGTSTISDVQYMSTRGPDGWTTHAVTPESAIGWSQTLGWTRGYASEDFSHLVFEAYDLPGASGDVPEGPSNLYWADANGENLKPLTSPFDPSVLLPPFYEYIYRNRLLGGSENYDTYYFTSIEPLLPEATPFVRNVYEWSDGSLKLAGYLPDGSLPPEGSEDPYGGGNATAPHPNLVSTDGDRMLFQAAAAGHSTELYMHRAEGNSVLISESELPGSTGDAEAVALQLSTPDLRHVAFTTRSRLTEEDPGGEGYALYLYTDTPDPTSDSNLRFLHRRNESHPPEVLGMGSDGQHGYFLGNARTIFTWDDAGVEEVLGGKSGIGYKPILEDVSGEADRRVFEPFRNVQVSADGRTIAFRHDSSVDGGPLTADDIEPGRLALYVYSSVSGRVACASCPPSGEAVSGEPKLFPAAPEDRGLSYAIRAPRFLSADGRRVFFSTPDSLVPEDINGRYDAYEYDVDTGKPHLISSGHSEQASWYAGSSDSGDDAFFITAEPLSRHDVDHANDLYDARVGGGIAEPAAPAGTCEGDACQPPPVVLADPTPGSATFAGPGTKKASGKRHKRHGRHHRRKRHQRSAHHRRHNPNNAGREL